MSTGSNEDKKGLVAEIDLKGGNLSAFSDENYAIPITFENFIVSSQSVAFFQTSINIDEFRKTCDVISAYDCNARNRKRAPSRDLLSNKDVLKRQGNAGSEAHEFDGIPVGTAYLVVKFVNPETGKTERLYNQIYQGRPIFGDKYNQ